MTDPGAALTLTCSVCGEWYLTDGSDAGSTLLHLPSGRHRVLGPNGHSNPDTSAAALVQARVEVLALAVRLGDLQEDLERVMAHLDRINLADDVDLHHGLGWRAVVRE